MNSKKIFSIGLIICALVLISGTVSAAVSKTSASKQTQIKKTTKTSNTKKNVQSSAPISAKYTPAQQACIKAAQNERDVVAKAAINVLASATADALKIKKASMKKAASALSTATKNELKKKQTAIAAAQKNKNLKIRADQIKLATDIYNSSPNVIKAKASYTKAIKAANDIYNNNSTVKKEKLSYVSAVKAANDRFQINQKACLPAQSVASKGFFGNIWSSISGFFHKMFSIF